MTAFFAYIGRRLAEPSSHAALAAMAVASIPLFGHYGTVAAAVFGILGFGLPEKTP